MRVYEHLRRVARVCGLSLLIGLATGCNFDAEYQYNLRFPASLIIKNETAGNVVINAILSSPEADSTFVLKGGSMRQGESLRLRIAEADSKVILAGSFVLRGTCRGRQNWEVSGRKLARKEFRDVHRWDVTVWISTCDP